MNDKKITLLGTGAQAKYALEIFHLRNIPVDSVYSLPGENSPDAIESIFIKGNIDKFEDSISKRDKLNILIVTSNNKLKESVFKRLKKYNFNYISAIHPSAIIARTSKVGKGVIINAHAVVQPYARVGNFAMIHAGAIVEHDCVVKDFVNLAPRVALAGYVQVGSRTTVYTGSVVAPKVKIGSDSIIGAGSTVLKDIGNKVVAVGSPAKEVRQNN